MSVRKRNWTTRKGEERTAWVVNYTDRDGIRRLETFDKKKDADARASQVDVDVRSGVHVPRGTSITVAQAGKHWIEQAEADKLERTTVVQYQGHLDDHINPYIGSKKLADLTGPDITTYEQDLRKAGVSDAMRRKVLVSLSSILRLAMTQGYVNRNVSERRHIKKASKRTKRKLKIGEDIPSLEEIRKFIAALTKEWRPFFLTAIFTGMRLSELRGLRWINVDLARGEIHVRERADAFHEMGPPKSESGQRTIPIGPMVVNTLKEWKLACPRRDTGTKDAAGEPVKEAVDLVFPTKKGHVQSASNIRRRGLIPLMKKAGLTVPAVNEKGKPVLDDKRKPVLDAKYTGLHALRHFYASWLINPKDLGGQGLAPKVVQKRLGHSTLAMTMDTYGHLFPRGDDAAQLREAEIALIG
jgi:integrase